MNIIGCTVSYSQLGTNNKPVDNEITLPLSYVASKDGRVIAQRLKMILSESGIDPDDVVYAVTDGGGDNHGGDKITGHGLHGTLAEALKITTWMWCTGNTLSLTSPSALPSPTPSPHTLPLAMRVKP